MSGAQQMLEQLFKSGLGLIEGQRGGGRSLDLRQLGGGAAAGGVLGLLLGSKRGRSLGGKALKVGSLAALGVLAYKAYQSWQSQQQPASGIGGAGGAGAAASATPQLPAPSEELRSQALLRAMVGAAKSDGHLDERERGLLDAELERLQAEPELRRWLNAELARPLDPAQVAQAASSPELASEMYLASLLMVDETSFMERAYLDELTRQLRLPQGLKEALEAQAAQAAVEA
ncbi:MAG: hypothetical protein CFE41_17755 [Burkholderiales bacterium PBB2]|nr:MAG: hypothetical protein CFE41_17755 [Burkholderiales bacterium PBB2]